MQNVCIITAAAFHCIGGAILQIPICTGSVFDWLSVGDIGRVLGQSRTMILGMKWC